ncbi:hypothetical protein [Glycomyces sp. NPDC048151]|uniref:hypothetical protein n=1 Tax=Glycomyces sp. NPDC048151 TaxID=3364002 RepID=UPI0037179338
MDTTEPTGDFYETDLEFSAQQLGEIWEHESYMLRFNLPAGLSHREADTLAHQIVSEIADRHCGAASYANLGRAFDSSAFALLSRKPGSTVSGATSFAELEAVRARIGRG